MDSPWDSLRDYPKDSPKGTSEERILEKNVRGQSLREIFREIPKQNLWTPHGIPSETLLNILLREVLQKTAWRKKNEENPEEQKP